jgi:seryl-tRNA synthetase
MKGLEIITDSTLKDHLLALSKRVSSIRAQFDQKEIKQTEMEKSIAAILADIQAVPTESIEIEDSISVSMIFPRVTMPIIRKIMKHPLVCIVPVS